MLISRLAALLAVGGDNVQIASGVIGPTFSLPLQVTDAGFKPDLIILTGTGQLGTGSYYNIVDFRAIWGDYNRSRVTYYNKTVLTLDPIPTTDYGVILSSDTASHASNNIKITRTSGGFKLDAGWVRSDNYASYHYFLMKYT